MDKNIYVSLEKTVAAVEHFRSTPFSIIDNNLNYKEKERLEKEIAEFWPILAHCTFSSI